MQVDVVLLPRDLKPGQLKGRAVVVFDVLRATTSMLTALSAGVKEIRVFPDGTAAMAARDGFVGSSLLCGEQNALPPKGFDLGNSPPAFTPEICAGRTIFISTTNGTGAILAAKEASVILIGALVNARAIANYVADTGLPVTLLCSGTNGEVSMEDLIGCGAVMDGLSVYGPVVEESDTAFIARRLFASARDDLLTVLKQTRGGRNIQRVGLSPDIDFAADLDCLDIVGKVMGYSPAIIRNAAVV